MRAELLNRPLLLLAAGLIVGLSSLTYNFNVLFLIPLLVYTREIRAGWAIVLGFGLGLILAPRIPEQGVLDHQMVAGDVRVVSMPRLYSDRLGFELEFEGHRLVTTQDRDADVSLGDLVSVKGSVRPLKEGTEDFYLSHGIVGRLRTDSLEVKERGPSWYRAAMGIRRGFVDFTHEALGAREAAVVDALCFNVDEGLDDGFKDDLRATGTIHIISASGLHVFVIAWVLERLLRLLPIPRGWMLVGLGLLLALYACAAGLQSAIVRSVVMSMLGLTAYLWERESDLLSALAFAAVGYLVFVPLAVFDIGFQFSFLTVGAFGLFGRMDSDRVETPKEWVLEKLKEGYRTTLIAFAATAPMVAFYFGFVSITTLPANLIIAPIVMVSVVAALVSFGLRFVLLPFAVGLMKLLVGPLVIVMQAVLSGMGRLSLNPTLPASFSGYWLVLIYVLVLALARRRVRPA
ncbi:MAG: ComEC/Rec2 family competence protein [Armatimonadetes bacterium]|nr:ComEC/Rec2 family competence protein [Armatimonadota bacterium]